MHVAVPRSAGHASSALVQLGQGRRDQTPLGLRVELPDASGWPASPCPADRASSRARPQPATPETTTAPPTRAGSARSVPRGRPAHRRTHDSERQREDEPDARLTQSTRGFHDHLPSRRDRPGRHLVNQGTISAATERAAGQLAARGIALIAATARTPAGVAALVRLAPYLTVSVCCGGALGWSPRPDRRSGGRRSPRRR